MKANEFGTYIKRLRNKRGMTIRQLELYSGVSNSYLSQLENGKRGIPSPDIIKKLSTGLRVDYEELMIKAGYMEEHEGVTKRERIINKIAAEFSDADLMFEDMESLTAEQLQEVYNFIKFKKEQKKEDKL